jgi:hypothetical protein
VTPTSPVSSRAGAPSASPRAEDAARAASEAEIPADASSSSFIFYTGLGLAAAIVLLSLAAFVRGGSEEAGKPRSL